MLPHGCHSLVAVTFLVTRGDPARLGKRVQNTVGGNTAITRVQRMLVRDLPCYNTPTARRTFHTTVSVLGRLSVSVSVWGCNYGHGHDDLGAMILGRCFRSMALRELVERC